MQKWVVHSLQNETIFLFFFLLSNSCDLATGFFITIILLHVLSIWKDFFFILSYYVNAVNWHFGCALENADNYHCHWNDDELLIESRKNESVKVKLNWWQLSGFFSMDNSIAIHCVNGIISVYFMLFNLKCNEVSKIHRNLIWI